MDGARQKLVAFSDCELPASTLRGGWVFSPVSKYRTAQAPTQSSMPTLHVALERGGLLHPTDGVMEKNQRSRMEFGRARQ